MRTIEIPFLTRIKLTGLLQNARAGDGGIVKLTSLQRVYEAIRFTEEDRAVLTVTDLGPPLGTEIRITDPAAVAPETLAVVVKLEDEWVTWFNRTLEDWLPNATLADLAWYEPLKAQLAARKPEPKMEFKRRTAK
jgi:hypothetical protein